MCKIISMVVVIMLSIHTLLIEFLELMVSNFIKQKTNIYTRTVDN